MTEQYHIAVMAAEVTDHLRVVQDGFYVYCTLGGGGHSLEILKKGGNVLGIDRDTNAVTYAVKRLSSFEGFKARAARFSEISEIVGSDRGKVDGIVMDLGVSSRMIDDPSRGFSYRHDGPLLMTMERDGETASHVLNTKSAGELTAIFRTYGEERHAGRIARAIVARRSSHPVSTTGELAGIIRKAVGSSMPQKSMARIFQALRIYVNKETEELSQGLEGALQVLGPECRLCVISYHSIEDRIVKNFMRDKANPCICPPDLPECRCGRAPELTIITRKPLRPSPEEVGSNPRARSAMLRVCEKVKNPEADE